MTNLYFEKFLFQTQIIIPTMNTLDYIMQRDELQNLGYNI